MMKRFLTKSSKREQRERGLLEQPWRELGEFIWGEKYATQLIDEIKKHDIGEDIPNIRILLLGQIKAGKSSFLNTVTSIDKGRMTQITRSGGAASSLTLKLKQYIPQRRLNNICILDTMGFEDEERGLHIKDILLLVEGHISIDYEFNPATHIKVDSPQYNDNPNRGDRVHCVVFVVDANMLGQDNVSDATRRQTNSAIKELNEQDVPIFVLITKIDVLCPLVEKDVTKTFHSEKVKEAVDVAHELYAIPTCNIFVVKNYENEAVRDVNKEIL